MGNQILTSPLFVTQGLASLISKRPVTGHGTNKLHHRALNAQRLAMGY